MQMEGGGGGGVTHFVFEIRRVENYPKFDKFSCYSRQFFLQLVPQFARRVQVARNVALRNTCTTPKKFVAALRGSLRKVEPTSTSRNGCGTKKVAKDVHFRVCYTGQFFVQHVSQQNCETSCKKRVIGP